MNLPIHRNAQPAALTLGCIMAAGLCAAPAHSGGFDEALIGGKPNVDMRLRYETVQDNINKDAKGLTLRTRLGYQTGDYKGLFAFGEFEDVRIVAGVDEYAPLTSGYAVIADPEVTQVNQALLGYKTFAQTIVKLGRQRITLDNHRFVGNVGWRQNEQTFDALSIVNKGLADTTLTYAYLDQVKGILKAFDADVSDHLLNASYSGFKPVKITTYAYLLKDDNSTNKNNSYGIRLNGEPKIGEKTKLLYTAELATQRTDNNNALYAFLEGGLDYSSISAKLAYELLGSDDGQYGFQTPLATKHAFNGWADQFLATPTDGLQDISVSLGGKAMGVKLLGVYHNYTADQGNADYGNEIDLLAARKFGKRYQLGIKYARYSAKSWKTDTDKLWLWAQLTI